jgi:hypothetical protein
LPLPLYSPGCECPSFNHLFCCSYLSFHLCFKGSECPLLTYLLSFVDLTFAVSRMWVSLLTCFLLLFWVIPSSVLLACKCLWLYLLFAVLTCPFIYALQLVSYP